MKPDNTVLKNLRLRDTKTEVREWSEKMAGGMLSNEWTLGGRTKLKFLASADSLANGLANAWWLPGTGLQCDEQARRNINASHWICLTMRSSSSRPLPQRA